MQHAKQRASNMELLRIAAMFMIIVFHIYLHNVVPQVSAQSESYPYFGVPAFSSRIALLSVFKSFGATGNGIFILISGYFMAQRESKAIDVGSTTKKLLLQFGFATAALCVLSMVCSHLISKTYIPIITDTFFNSDMWFVGYYLLIILFAKFFLNDFLQRASKREYAAALLVMFALTQFSWTRSLIDGFSDSLSILLTGLVLYAGGGYIRKYDPFGRIRSSVVILLGIFIYLMIFVSVYNMTQTALQESFWNHDEFVHPVRSYSNSNFIIFAAAVVWFELFRRIRVPNSKVINFLGQSTFIVYIVHENKFFHALWDLTNWQPLFFDAPTRFYTELAKWTVISFLSGVAVYAAYLAAEKVISKCGWIIFKKDVQYSRSDKA